MAMVEELFSRRLPVSIKLKEKEDKRLFLTATIEIAKNVSSRELTVRLTNENDLLFLYLLKLNDDDYQTLKVQQALLIDFVSFPQKLIDFFHLVLSEEHKEFPRFLLELDCIGKLCESSCSLNVVEATQFKNLCHLSLKFLPGTDKFLKDYLASCLKKLIDTERELTGQLKQAREALSTRTIELEGLKNDWESKLKEINNTHMNTFTKEKEEHFQIQTETQKRFESEKQAQWNSVKSLESKIMNVENNNRDLVDKKYKSDSLIRELKSKVECLEEENRVGKQEIQALRKNNGVLDSDVHEQEKVVNQLKTKLAVSEEKNKTTEMLNEKSSDLLKAEIEQKKHLQSELERSQRQVTNLESAVKILTDENKKVNEIVKKLRNYVSEYQNKVKLLNTVTVKQEKAIEEKKVENNTLKQDMSNDKLQIKQKEDEIESLNHNLKTITSKLEESREMIKSNENIITFLNKQMTENQIGLNTLPSSSNHNSMAPSTINRSNADSNTFGHSFGSNVKVMSHPLHIRTPTIDNKYINKNVKSHPIAKSSPLIHSSIPEASIPNRSPMLSSKNTNIPTDEPFIDPKYLQTANGIRSNGVKENDQHRSIHFKQMSQETDARGPSRTNDANPQPFPPLASAYFPGRTHIS